jgi:hypothetical protein
LSSPHFIAAPVTADHRNNPLNALGYFRVMSAVDNINQMLEKLRKRGAQLKQSSTKTRIGSPTSAGLKGFSLGSPKTDYGGRLRIDVWLRIRLHFLATTTTRMCINFSQSAQSRREIYVSPWLREPVDTSSDPL